MHIHSIFKKLKPLFFYLKSDPHLPKKNIFICFNESALKVIKNAFYSILKALFVLKIFKFLSWVFRYVEKTAWLVSKFMTSQPGWQTIAIHILTNISRSKRDQTLKFDQVIEYYRINILFKNYTKNEAGRLVAGLFLFFKKLHLK